MCGRFSLIENQAQLQEEFQFEIQGQMKPRYNIAPGQQILTIVMEDGIRVGKEMKWGFVPFWSKDPKIGYRMINTRAEGIDSKPSFKAAFKRRRALILSSGFYEWQKTEDGKQPYRFIMKNQKPFAFAGIWETWDKGNTPLVTCSIITTSPNAVTEPIHDRMPVILHHGDYENWLNPKMVDTEYLKSLLVPYPAEEMNKYPVSTLVNSPRNELSEIISPLNSL